VDWSWIGELCAAVIALSKTLTSARSSLRWAFIYLIRNQKTKKPRLEPKILGKLCTFWCPIKHFFTELSTFEARTLLEWHERLNVRTSLVSTTLTFRLLTHRWSFRRLCWVLSRTLQDDWRRRSKPRSFPSCFASKREIRRPHTALYVSLPDRWMPLPLLWWLGDWDKGALRLRANEWNQNHLVWLPADLLSGRLGALSWCWARINRPEFVFEQLIRYSNQLTFVNPNISCVVSDQLTGVHGAF
jgi:hypothetical protein